MVQGAVTEKHLEILMGRQAVTARPFPERRSERKTLNDVRFCDRDYETINKNTGSLCGEICENGDMFCTSDRAFDDLGNDPSRRPGL